MEEAAASRPDDRKAVLPVGSGHVIGRQRTQAPILPRTIYADVRINGNYVELCFMRI